MSSYADNWPEVCEGEGGWCTCRRSYATFGTVTPYGQACQCACHINVAAPVIEWAEPARHSYEARQRASRLQPYQDAARIVALWEEGRTFTEIAAEYDCTPSAIAYHVRKVHPEAVKTPTDQSWRNVQMCIERAEGVTLVELSRRYGLSKGRVGQIVGHSCRHYALMRNLRGAFGTSFPKVNRVLDYAKVLW